MSDLFTPQEREIFEFFDGRRKIKADPLAVYRKFVHHCGGDPDRWLADRWAGVPEEEFDAQGNPTVIDAAQEPKRFAAVEVLLAAARAAFAMAPFDPETGEGALEADCLNAMDEFLVWLDQKKRRAG